MKLENLMTKDREGDPLSRDICFEDNQTGWYIPKYDCSVVVTLVPGKNGLCVEMKFDKTIPEDKQKQVEHAVQNAIHQMIDEGKL